MERSVEKAAFGFFGAKQDFSGQELTEATDVDFVRTVALVTCHQGGEGEKIIGAGRCIASGNAEPPDRAEVVFTVEKEYHGLGWPVIPVCQACPVINGESFFLKESRQAGVTKNGS